MAADTIADAGQTVEGGFSSHRSDLVAIEEPLQFCLNGFPLSITMRSPGSDLDLAVGFLFRRFQCGLQSWSRWRQKRIQKSASDGKYLITLGLEDELEDL